MKNMSKYDGSAKAKESIKAEQEHPKKLKQQYRTTLI